MVANNWEAKPPWQGPSSPTTPPPSEVVHSAETERQLWPRPAMEEPVDRLHDYARASTECGLSGPRASLDGRSHPRTTAVVACTHWPSQCWGSSTRPRARTHDPETCRSTPREHLSSAGARGRRTRCRDRPSPRCRHPHGAGQDGPRESRARSRSDANLPILLPGSASTPRSVLDAPTTWSTETCCNQPKLEQVVALCACAASLPHARRQRASPGNATLCGGPRPRPLATHQSKPVERSNQRGRRLEQHWSTFVA
mmetsp:Transcript_5025/g.13896  ORF Transcript_5025/g.13896 Transcript_5025/m.13896 type:complete len:255 (+) Transcript_5025:214-978(+)